MHRRLMSATLAANLVMTSGVLAASPPHFDEMALRYYASLGQTSRVAAEARRLSQLDPRWHVPRDLGSLRPGRPDEGPLWSLYAANHIADLQNAIAQRQAVEPGWTPSDDLASKLKAKLARTAIMKMARGKDWHAIVQSFGPGGIAWAKDDAQALWVIAEAFARENECEEAYAVYRSILADHVDPNERRATIEFAIPLIPMALTEKLIAMGRTEADGRSEFASIGIDITRARLSAFLHDAPAEEPNDVDLEAFKDHVRSAADPNESGLVAWYAYKKDDYAAALDWFKLAIGHGGDAMIAHGLAHTLRRLGRRRDAEEVAYAWREPLVNNAILFIDLLETDLTAERPPLVEPDRLARYAKVTMETESGEGAQALAWYAYNTCEYTKALEWFERANAWLPKEATVYGLALAYRQLHRPKDFRTIVNRYDGLFPKVVALAFDDGIRKPPTACRHRRPILASGPRADATSSAADWTARTMVDTLRPGNFAATHARPFEAMAAIPSPEAVRQPGLALPPMRKRTEFPFAVAAENTLRFSVLQTVAAQGAAQGVTSALVARRVPGVGSMPYERYGFTLAPGWDGTREASVPSYAERAPPRGTLWSQEQLPPNADVHVSPRLDGVRLPTAAQAVGAPSPPDRRS